MKPIHFTEETTTLARNQPQFRTLPVAIARENPEDPESVFRFTCKYELSDLEIQQIIKSKCVFISQFGYGFQPISAQIDSPFLVLPVEYKYAGNRMYHLKLPLVEGKQTVIAGVQLEKVIDVLTEATGLKPDQFLFKEMAAMAVSEKGLEEL